MQPVFPAIFAAVFALAAPGLVAAPATSNSSEVHGLLAQLTDPDPALRRQASERLLKLGPDARQDLLAASRSDDPERRSRAGQILLQLPWWRQDDPPEIRAALEPYGGLEEGGRIQFIENHARNPAMRVVLLRLLEEEPNERVRWSIVRSLGAAADDDALQEKLRAMEPPESDAPMLLLSGRAWFARDRARALALLRRAIDADEKRPVADASQIYFAFDRLLDEQIKRGDFDGAAAMLRRQVAREVGAGRSALARLAALHKYFGPLRGYDQDLRVWSGPAKSSDDPGKPTLSARISGWSAGLSAPLTLPSDELARRWGFGPEERMYGGYFLFQHDWLDAAEAELRLGLAGDSAKNRLELQASLNYLLSRVYVKRGDDDSAASSLQQFMLIITRGGMNMPGRPEEDLWAEVFFLRAKAAHKSGATTRAVNAIVSDMIRFTPANTDNAINIVTWLKETNHPATAAQVFNRVYEQAKARIASSGNDPTAMNDTAWLCARSGERLDEALSLINRALEVRPNSSAYLDTAAEVNFRLGHRDKAIALEERALALDPDEPFMREQLQRFRTGVPATRASPR